MPLKNPFSLSPGRGEGKKPQPRSLPPLFRSVQNFPHESYRQAALIPPPKTPNQCISHRTQKPPHPSSLSPPHPPQYLQLPPPPPRNSNPPSVSRRDARAWAWAKQSWEQRICRKEGVVVFHLVFPFLSFSPHNSPSPPFSPSPFFPPFFFSHPNVPKIRECAGSNCFWWFEPRVFIPSPERKNREKTWLLSHSFFSS